MAKKTFKENINPAMNFISAESIERAEEAERPAAQNLTKPDTEQAKNLIKLNIEPGREVSAAPAGYKPNYLYIETKSERIQLLMQPSLKAKLKAKAAKDGRSLNDEIHTILAAAVEE